MSAATKRRLPPLWTLMAVLSALYISLSVGLTMLLKLPWRVPMPRSPGFLIGVLLLLLGASLYVWGARSLGARRSLGGELFLPKSESTLVTGGLYAHTRNPLYLSVIILLLGWLLVLRWTPIIFLTGFFAVHFLLVAKWEEKELLARFGPEYEEYRRRVPFFIPRRRQSGADRIAGSKD